MNGSVPKTRWLLERLGDVTSVGSGAGFPTVWQGSVEGKYPFYKVSDMNLPGNEVWMRNHNNAITEITRVKLKAKHHPEGTIIFPKIGAAIATNKKRILAKISCFDNNVIGIYPSPKLDTSFLYHLLVRTDLSEFANTGNPPSIRKTTLENWEIPLPPLAEQKRIAKILDTADALRAKRRESLAQLDTLLQSTFLDMFGDPVTNPMGWEKPILEAFCRPRQWPTIKKTELSDAGYPVFGANGQIGFYFEYNHAEATVLITCRGATCGTINVCEPMSYVTGNAMALDDLNQGRVHLRYLEHALAATDFTAVITGVAQPQITRRSLKQLSVPIPPLDLQHDFATIVESTEQHKATQRAHLDELDTLFASLQSRAFRGEF